MCGLRHEGLQQKVLAERDLTWEKALSLTQAHETARHEMKLLRGEPQSSRQTYQTAETTFTVQASGGRRFTPRDSRAKERVCHRCDGRNHDSEKCWYKSAICRVCNVRGHIAKAGLQETEAIWPEVSSELWLGISEPQASIEVDETLTPNELSRRRRRGEYDIYSDRKTERT